MLKMTAESDSGDALKKEVVESIDEFAAWFEEQLKNEKLSLPERAIIDTYCYWMVKIRGKKEGAVTPAPSP